MEYFPSLFLVNNYYYHFARALCASKLGALSFEPGQLSSRSLPFYTACPLLVQCPHPPPLLSLHSFPSIYTHSISHILPLAHHCSQLLLPTRYAWLEEIFVKVAAIFWDIWVLLMFSNLLLSFFGFSTPRFPSVLAGEKYFLTACLPCILERMLTIELTGDAQNMCDLRILLLVLGSAISNLFFFIWKKWVSS